MTLLDWGLIGAGTVCAAMVFWPEKQRATRKAEPDTEPGLPEPGLPEPPPITPEPRTVTPSTPTPPQPITTPDPEVVKKLRALDGKAPRRLTSDVTPERLAGLMAENGGRIALVSAEGGPFKIMAGQYSSNGGPAILDTYLKSWRGKQSKLTGRRVGRS